MPRAWNLAPLLILPAAALAALGDAADRVRAPALTEIAAGAERVAIDVSSALADTAAPADAAAAADTAAAADKATAAGTAAFADSTAFADAAALPDTAAVADCVAAVAGALRLMPPASDPPLEGQGLPMKRIFARIDSLDALLATPSTPDRGRLAFRLAQLYLATDMFKHRRTALEYLDQAIALDPALFEAYRLRAATAQRMQYPGQAERWYGQLTKTFPGQAQGHLGLAHFEFLEGRKLLDHERFTRARNAYAAAVSADSTSMAGWLGLGGCELILGEYAAAASTGDHLAASDSFATAGLLLAGAARTALQQDEAAWGAFHRALDSLDPWTRQLFLLGKGLVLEDALRHGYAAVADSATLLAAMQHQDGDWKPQDGINLKKAARDTTVRRVAVEAWWRDRNPWPTHLANRDRLVFWRRMVEADLLFGEEHGAGRGWETEPGMAWVRWGPPTETRYEAPGFGDLLDMFEGTPIRGERLGVGVSQHVGYWMWIYRLPDNAFGLLFRDLTYHKRWVTTRDSRQSLLAFSKQVPLIAEPPPQREPALAVGVVTAGFQRGAGRSTLEAYVAVTPLKPEDSPGPPAVAAAAASGTPALARPATAASPPLPLPADLRQDSTALALVELAVFDSGHHRIQYERHTLGAERRLGSLLRALGDAAARDGEGPLLLQFAADLPPGDYEVALDVTDVRDGGHRAVRSQVVLEPPTTGMLALSDLQLAATFSPCSAPLPIPVEFVKHGYGIIPVPAGVYAEATEDVYVYYEVYNLSTGKDGQTRFNVTYDIYRDRQSGNKGKPLKSFRRGGNDRIDPMSVTFLEETSGISAQRHVVKGGEVDIAELAPGRYVLVVTIEDLLSGEKTSRFQPFRKAKAEARSAGSKG
jgi:GWxTD domain-containing protein